MVGSAWVGGYIGELVGAYFAIKAAALSGHFVRIVIDNSAVQIAAAKFSTEMSKARCRLPKSFSSWWSRISGLHGNYSTHWVPNHGKYPDYG